MNGKNARQTALEILDRLKLWPVPIRPGEKAPIGESWGATRPTARDIERIYDQYPRAGVGILLGPDAGVIDVECDGPQGPDSLRKLCGGDPPATLGWNSHRGPHHIFRHSPRLAKLGKTVIKRPDLPDLEIRLGGDGKQFQSNCPPTAGDDDKPRQWGGCWVIADLPEAAIAFLETAPPPAPARPAPAAPPWMTSTASGHDGYATRALDEECSAVATAANGERNARLNTAAFSLGQLVGARVLDRGTAEQRLMEAASDYIRSDGEHAARKTIRSGLDAGEKLPRDLSHLASPRPAVSISSVQAPRPWPPLRSPELPPAAPFPLRVLPLPARRLVEEGAKAIGCPPDFLAVAAIGVAAGAIGRSASLMLKSGYFAPAILFQANIGPPSDGKSPALKMVASGIYKIADTLAEEYADAFARWEKDADRPGRDGKKQKTPPRPRPRRIDVDDATMEVLPLLLADNPRGLVMIRDELAALILGLNQYKAGGKGSDRPTLLKLWAGQPITKDRVNHADHVPVRVPHPCLSIIGGIQPDMLGELVDPRGRADGFLDRFLLSYPEAEPVPHWSDEGVATDALDDWSALIARLWLRPLDVKDGRSVPHVVRFTDSGKGRWIELYDLHADEMRTPEGDALRGPWGKFRDHAARLALVLALMRHAADPTANPDAVPDVDPLVVDDAWRLADYFKSHARRVHAAISRGPADPDALSLLSWIKRRGATTFREADVRSDLRRYRDDPPALAGAIKALTDRGVIRSKPEDRDPATPGPKPTPLYEVHPALLEAPGITEDPGIGSAAPPNGGNSGNSGRQESPDGDREVFEL
ncbi:DUF3987 domain-containing protein [Aquisphaera insulae]|uniref:DUF3987 domain-containing protein n=1 Tax=Aquisphaera insulae TaxID=2712864 RepID=UPI0013EDA7F3|nr:DUF3987 domain-containing protein [Aquisphaera insulae]